MGENRLDGSAVRRAMQDGGAGGKERLMGPIIPTIRLSRFGANKLAVRQYRY